MLIRFKSIRLRRRNDNRVDEISHDNFNYVNEAVSASEIAQAVVLQELGERHMVDTPRSPDDILDSSTCNQRSTNGSESKAPNKAKLARRARAMSGSVLKRSPVVHPAIQEFEADQSGWLDISCLRR